MTEPTAAPWRTPNGYRVVGSSKLLRINKTEDLWADATDCELEL